MLSEKLKFGITNTEQNPTLEIDLVTVTDLFYTTQVSNPNSPTFK